MLQWEDGTWAKMYGYFLMVVLPSWFSWPGVFCYGHQCPQHCSYWPCRPLFNLTTFSPVHPHLGSLVMVHWPWSCPFIAITQPYACPLWVAAVHSSLVALSWHLSVPFHVSLIIPNTLGCAVAAFSAPLADSMLGVPLARVLRLISIYHLIFTYMDLSMMRL
jgi:hypothetical protein